MLWFMYIKYGINFDIGRFSVQVDNIDNESAGYTIVFKFNSMEYVIKEYIINYPESENLIKLLIKLLTFLTYFRPADDRDSRFLTE